MHLRIIAGCSMFILLPFASVGCCKVLSPNDARYFLTYLAQGISRVGKDYLKSFLADPELRKALPSIAGVQVLIAHMSKHVLVFVARTPADTSKGDGSRDKLEDPAME